MNQTETIQEQEIPTDQPVGYVRKSDLATFLKEGANWETIGLDHPRCWEDEPSYSHLIALYAVPAAQSLAPISIIAKSITGMVMEYAEYGIKHSSDWKSGLEHIITRRLSRFVSPAKMIASSYQIPPMTLDDAIKHAQDVAGLECGSSCGKQHQQLADWLEELKKTRTANFRDAYDGAREEVAIWKRRALEAEAILAINKEMTQC